MRFIRDTKAYAFFIGLYERTRFGDGFGRTHSTDQGWNVAYDRGANLSDFITGTRLEG